MILPTAGRSEESMFPANKYSYDDNAGFCESYYGVAPRPHWITTEFGGHVSPPWRRHHTCNHCRFPAANLHIRILLLPLVGHHKGVEKVREQHHILQRAKGSMERWRVRTQSILFVSVDGLKWCTLCAACWSLLTQALKPWLYLKVCFLLISIPFPKSLTCDSVCVPWQGHTMWTSDTPQRKTLCGYRMWGGKRSTS